MLSTRRQFALSSVVFLSGIAGCNDFLDDESLREVHLELLNRTAELRTFHFVLEADDGLGEWHEFALDPDANRQVVVEPASDRDWTGYHAVSGETQVSGSLRGQWDESTCLQLECVIYEDDIETWISTSQPLC